MISGRLGENSIKFVQKRSFLKVLLGVLWGEKNEISKEGKHDFLCNIYTPVKNEYEDLWKIVKGMKGKWWKEINEKRGKIPMV